MKPTTEREREIADRVDAKAAAIADTKGQWGDDIIAEMKIAVPFELRESELQFLENYVIWKRNKRR